MIFACFAAVAAMIGPTQDAGVGTRPSVASADAESAQLAESRRFFGELDSNRLLEDEAYAELALVHIERARRLAPTGSEVAAGLDQLRLLALASLDRREEASSELDRLTSRRDRRADWYAPLFFTALRVEDLPRAAAVIDSAGRSLPASEWATMRDMLARPLVWEIIRSLERDGHEAARTRMAEALLRIGWPAIGDRQSSDALRSILVKARVTAGEIEAAADLAAGITTTSNLLPLLLLKRYDPLFGGQDRVDILRRALAEEDRSTAAELEAAPGNNERLLERAQLLRSLGRSAEAASLLAQPTRDVAGTTAADRENGVWLVNEAGYALAESGRIDEMVRLMSRLVAVPLDENPELIGPSINFSAMLWAAGRPEQALTHARQLERTGQGFANEYGKMWIDSSLACALSQLGRDDEAQTILARMRPRSEENPAALMRAYLCINDLDAAEALLIERLESDDPETAILGLQEFAPTAANAAISSTEAVFGRLAELRRRPAVRQALDRVGHLLQLPVGRVYWGTF